MAKASSTKTTKKKKAVKKKASKKKVTKKKTVALKRGLSEIVEVKQDVINPSVSGPLSVEWVDAIIKVCQEGSVSSFKYGELSIDFNHTVQEIRNSDVDVLPIDENPLVGRFKAKHGSKAGSSGSRLSELDLERVERSKAIEQDGNFVDEELELLKVTNPEQYEEFLASGDAV